MGYLTQSCDVCMRSDSSSAHSQKSTSSRQGEKTALVGHRESPEKPSLPTLPASETVRKPFSVGLVPWPVMFCYSTCSRCQKEELDLSLMVGPLIIYSFAEGSALGKFSAERVTQSYRKSWNTHSVELKSR